MEKNADKEPPDRKPLHWVGSSRKDIRELSDGVRSVFGQALLDAQDGKKHPDAKPLKGFKGAGVLEVVESDEGGTYRAVYTVKFADIVYVLHVFQKKSKVGKKTPPEDINKVKDRLRKAEADYAKHLKKRESSEEAQG